MREKIRDYIKAGFAGLYLLTPEEVRAEAAVKAVAEELGYRLFSWTVVSGILDLQTGSVNPVVDAVEAVQAVGELPERSILLLKDFHQFLGDPGQPASPLVTRVLKEKVREARNTSRVLGE